MRLGFRLSLEGVGVGGSGETRSGPGRCSAGGSHHATGAVGSAESGCFGRGRGRSSRLPPQLTALRTVSRVLTSSSFSFSTVLLS